MGRGELLCQALKAHPEKVESRAMKLGKGNAPSSEHEQVYHAAAQC